MSTGIGNADMQKLQLILGALPQISFICVDVANGYSENFVNFIKNTRAQFKDKTIIAGNVVTQEMTEELIMSGADIVKVGIGPGSVCTTRRQTGVGYPQISAVIECADAAHGLGGRIISDGGCTCPGDVSKAFGAGADFVMLGGMLAGHDESGGEVLHTEAGSFKVFYGRGRVGTTGALFGLGVGRDLITFPKTADIFISIEELALKKIGPRSCSQLP